MTAEAQRIAIAEACGWQGPYHPENIAKMDGWWSQHRGIWWVNPCGHWVMKSSVPDYLNDLNACREFEEKLIALGPPALDTYEIFLSAICARAGNRIFRATAPQRCEAFLKTIKWVSASLKQ